MSVLLAQTDAGVKLEWGYPLPAWGWALVAVLALTLAAWSYRRLAAGRAIRGVLVLMRACALAGLAVLLASPRLVRQEERVEPDWLVVLADRSASMSIEDAPDGGARERQLREQLHKAWPAWAPQIKDRNILWLGFDSGAFDLPTSAAGAGLPVELGEPMGRRTDIDHALEHAMRQVAARPVSAFLVLSDGRAGEGVSRPVLRQLQNRQIPVFTVPLGRPDPPADFSIAQAQSPAAAFINDTVPVEVRLARTGEQGIDPGSVRVRLADTADGKVLDEKPWPMDGGEALTLNTTPASAGEAVWEVRLLRDNGGELKDLVEGNNRAQLRVRLVDRPLRVAYFEGVPRWEYRYVKNLLLREKSIRSSAMLLSSGRRAIQEGSDPLLTLPRSLQDWEQFDVIILGDLRPEMLGTEQLEHIRACVSDRGTGLVWIAGPMATPLAWRGTPLSELLPMNPAADSGASGMRAWSVPVVARAEPAARRYGVLRLGETDQEVWPAWLTQEGGWSQLRYVQQIDPAGLKPTAEVLATAGPAGGASGERTPLVITMRYGAGRSLYVATDETWRWRYGRGERPQERFWLPLFRMLARESLLRAGAPAVLTLSPQEVTVGRSVRVTLRLLDQSLALARPASYTVRFTPTGEGKDQRRPVEVVLRPEGQESAGSYAGVWIPQEMGEFVCEPTDAALLAAGVRARGVARWADDERLEPRADHALLAALSAQTGGRVLSGDELATLPQIAPNRRVRALSAAEVRTLWDRPLVLAVLVGLLALEWSLRRWVRLA